MTLYLITLFLCANSLWYRPLHIVYVQNPDETPEEHRKIVEERLDWWVKQLNDALDFHEIDFHMVAGDIYVKPSDPYYYETGYSCGEVRKTFCTPWTDELGRKTANTLEMWMCLMGPKIGCQGVGGGNTAMVKDLNFRRDDKIGVMHELGHCFGCGHKMGYCAPDHKQFEAVTGIRYQSLMGGGAACDSKGLKKERLRLFEDMTKKYCEAGVCISLGDENFKCATTIKKKFAEKVAGLRPQCGSDLATGINGGNFDFCVVEAESKCEPFVEFDTSMFEGEGDFVATNIQDCIEVMKLHENVCPSGTFFFNSGKDICYCCTGDYQTKEGKYDLIKIDIKPNSGSMIDFSMQDEASLSMNLLEPTNGYIGSIATNIVVYSFAIIGFANLIYFGFTLAHKKYEPIGEVAEI